MTSASPDQITRLTKHAAINLGIKVVFLDETEAEAKCFERADTLVEKSDWIVVGSKWNLDMRNNRCLVSVLTPKSQPKVVLSIVDVESGKVLAQITATGNKAQCQYNGGKPVACTLESFNKQRERL